MIPGYYKKSSVTIWLFRLGYLTIVIGAAIVMLYLSWGKWPDVLVDFGRELYVPWMLTEGKVLYRDIMYFNGPLSPYLNALCFVLFGPSLHTLVWTNLVLLAIMMLLIYLVLSNASSPFAAFIACLTFIFLFAFGQYVECGNYNYVCPYSHETTHGMLLSWAAITCLLSHARSHRNAWLVGAGFATGLVFLTKPEFFIAISAASVTAMILRIWLEKRKVTQEIPSIVSFVSALLIPPLIAWVLLSMRLSWSEAGIGTLGAWWYLWKHQIYELPFYRFGMGMDVPFVNLGKMFLVAGLYVAVLIPAAAIAMATRRKWTTITLTVMLFVALIIALRGFYLPWADLGRALPIFLVLSGGALLWAVHKHRQEKYATALILVVFSILLIGKMPLNTRLYHYGFALAMPAMLLWVLALLDWIPGAIKRLGGQQMVFIGAALIVLTIIITPYVVVSKQLYAMKTVAVSEGDDAFLADRRGKTVKLAVDWLNRNTQQQDTLIVLPEGIMINYLTRRPNSTPIVNLMPPEMLMFGEDRILQMLHASPPNYIVLVHKDTTEYGFRFFGTNYGKSISKWLSQNYRPTYLVDATPLQDDRFGILITKRISTLIE